MCHEMESEVKMPYAVLEKEIERLDETQRNTVALFVRFLLSQKESSKLSPDSCKDLMTSSSPNYLPKAPPSNIITLEGRFTTYEF